MTTNACIIKAFLTDCENKNQSTSEHNFNDHPCRRCCLILLLRYLAFRCDNPESFIEDARVHLLKDRS